MTAENQKIIDTLKNVLKDVKNPESAINIAAAINRLSEEEESTKIQNNTTQNVTRNYTVKNTEQRPKNLKKGCEIPFRKWVVENFLGSCNELGQMASLIDIDPNFTTDNNWFGIQTYVNKTAPDYASIVMMCWYHYMIRDYENLADENNSLEPFKIVLKEGELKRRKKKRLQK